MTQPNVLPSDRVALEIGPRPLPTRFTCNGCPALTTKYWKDYLDNDETDSGTSARCSAIPTEHGGESISAYWSPSDAPPKWCPAPRHRDASVRELVEAAFRAGYDAALDHADPPGPIFYSGTVDEAWTAYAALASAGAQP